MLFCIPFGFWIGRCSGPLLPTLVYDSCFESGGYEKTPAGNTQREAF